MNECRQDKRSLALCWGRSTSHLRAGKLIAVGASLGASLKRQVEDWLSHKHSQHLFESPSATKLLAAFDERCPKKTREALSFAGFLFLALPKVCRWHPGQAGASSGAT